MTGVQTCALPIYVADLVKDAIILPQAFLSALRGESEQEFRQSCIENLVRTESLDFMIDSIKSIAVQMVEVDA